MIQLIFAFHIDRTLAHRKFTTGQQPFLPHHLRFEGGGLPASSPAFLLAPNPNATFDRSLGTGVPECVGVSTADEILENPAFMGAGEAELLGAIEENPDGPGLSPFNKEGA